MAQEEKKINVPAIDDMSDDFAIVPTGSSTDAGKEAFEMVGVGAGTSLADLYDRHKKLIYLFDISGSMNSGMAADDMVKMYKWSAELLELFRQKIKTIQAMAPGADDDDGDDDEDEDDDILDAADPADDNPFDFNVDDDEALKKGIVEKQLDQVFQISLERDYGYRPNTRSKMDTVKDAAKSFVNTRFDKFPDAHVVVMQFNDGTKELTRGFGRQAVLDAIERLQIDGGTQIYQAVERAVNDCKKRPSTVGAHHIVLVSDGMDGGGRLVKQLLPKMLELNIVFDFIFVAGPDRQNSDDPVIQALSEVCKETGGEFVTVRTEKDFQQKFLAASSRLMLPAGSK